MEKILITGAAGYIGNCLFAYLNRKYDVYGLDKVKKKKNKFFKINLCNLKKTNKIIQKINPEIIIHLAGQSTIDGIKNKIIYKKNNENVTSNIVKLAKTNKIKNIIFSSTAAVYDSCNKKNCLDENSKLNPNNIYGITKLNCEKLIKKSKINYIIFRFFNVCSSIPFLKVGELHSPESHLIPLSVHKILANKIIKIYGNNFKTRDGTCIRDYIHIYDLCIAFEKAIKKMLRKKISKKIINLGSGRGYTNLEIVNKIISITKKNCKIKFTKKRVGDAAKLVCSFNKAKLLLKWKPQNSKLNKIIQDEIIWQKKNLNRKFIY
jgi:UDP-glucose 4-epimerase